MKEPPTKLTPAACAVPQGAPPVIDLPCTIAAQPDEETCGPACLHAVYRYFGETLPQEQVIAEVERTPWGGTLSVFLALHAQRRGYQSIMYTCNLQLFDPSWFQPGAPNLRERLVAQAEAKRDPRIVAATRGYLEFLDRGGKLLMVDLNLRLLKRLLADGSPIITGLSATWLYQTTRERPSDNMDDDAAGEPIGHFLIIRGVDMVRRRLRIADPWVHYPYPGTHYYDADADRVIAAILLGIVTYDAKLLVLRPPAAEGAAE